MIESPYILGIETSCDETAAAVARGRNLLSNVVASQVDIHARYGGIVPEVASRQHILAILPVVDRALGQANIKPGDLKAIAVTYGPGLAGSLMVGVNAAKALALAWDIPLIAVNHLEAHIYANWVIEDNGGEEEPVFPLLCLIVSGGHSDIVFMRDHLEYFLLGRTRDDAAGEAFDKAARLLGLGYPGGPAVQKAAEHGDGKRVKLPRAWLRGSDDFSFSGLKTALLRLVTSETLSTSPGSHPNVFDAAAAFQESVVEVLAGKAAAIARRRGVKCLLLSGGVAANGPLRRSLQETSPVPVFIPSLSLCTDNAAMVAVCGYYYWMAGRLSGLNLDVVPGLPLTTQQGSSGVFSQ